MPIDPEEYRIALKVLQSIVQDRGNLVHLDRAERNALLEAAGKVALPEIAERKRLLKEQKRVRARERRAQDEQRRGATGIRKGREAEVFITPRPHASLGQSSAQSDDTCDAGREVHAARHCYICKQPYQQLHFFYDQMCQACGDLNHEKRTQTADLRGRVALLTGGRVKIGYQAGILMLRAGAQLVVTTRFPRDAAARYHAEPDAGSWSHRLQIVGLDLRHTPSVETFAAHLSRTLPRLDFIIHNACQTVRRPPGFYEHLLERERTPVAQLPQGESALLHEHEVLQQQLSGQSLVRRDGGVPGSLFAVGLADAPGLSQLPLAPGDAERGQELFPRGRLDQDLQQVDLRDMNSWRMTLSEVPTVELLEVQLCNAIAPFVLNARLKALMLSGEPTRDKHIVNVSAMEGQFYRSLKTDKHPHTNMAKAALNMMTRTSAADYVRDGIHMNSVDTGWVSDEDPAHIAQRKREQRGFHPPLDIVDGAARIVDPIFDGFRTGKHVWGQFLKDYRPTPW